MYICELNKIMKVYESLIEQVISYRGDDGRATEFVIYVGDFFFIRDEIFWSKELVNDPTKYPYVKNYEYKSTKVLDKIYYKKTYFKEENKEKEMIFTNNINVLNPMIDYKYTIEDCLLLEKIKDVTEYWNRELKLKRILNG